MTVASQKLHNKKYIKIKIYCQIQGFTGIFEATAGQAPNMLRIMVNTPKDKLFLLFFYARRNRLTEYNLHRKESLYSNLFRM